MFCYEFYYFSRPRFAGFETEMNINASKVDVVNQLAHQLLDVDHPNSQDVMEKQSELRQRWANLGALADEKRDALNSTFAIQTFHIEVKETIIWIRDKTTLIQSTEELGTGNYACAGKCFFEGIVSLSFCMR